MTDQPRRTDYLDLDELADAPTNAKGHADTLIDESISRFGFVEIPILDGRTGKLIGGHGRRDSLRRKREAGETPPDGVIIGDDGRWLAPVSVGWSSADDAEAEAVGIALNRVGEVGGWQDVQLAESLARLAEQPAGLAGLGFDGDYLKTLLAKINAPDPWKDRPKADLPPPRSL